MLKKLGMFVLLATMLVAWSCSPATSSSSDSTSSAASFSKVTLANADAPAGLIDGLSLDEKPTYYELRLKTTVIHSSYASNVNAITNIVAADKDIWG